MYAMLASYVLSRTLVPTLVAAVHCGPLAHHGAGRQAEPPAARVSGIRRSLREDPRQAISSFSTPCSSGGGCSRAISLGFWRAVSSVLPGVHSRPGTSFRTSMPGRSACTCACRRVRASSRPRASPTRSRRPSAGSSRRATSRTVLDNLGVAVSGINKTYSNSGTFASLDGEIQLSLNDGHAPTEHYMEAMRRELPRRFPGVEFFFQPADMVTQILNFGVPAALDVKVTGAGLRADYDVAAELKKRIEMIPGTVDTHIHQRPDVPTIMLSMDRTQLQQLGLSPSDVTFNLISARAPRRVRRRLRPRSG